MFDLCDNCGDEGEVIEIDNFLLCVVCRAGEAMESPLDHRDHSDLRVCQGIGCMYGDQHGPS